MENENQCLHTFRSVYYGSEWEVECEKCDKNVRDLYSNDDALLIVENMLTENKKNEMENMNTTLEIPEGSKATIAGKNIDGKYYLVVEVENKSDMIDIEEKARIMLEKTRANLSFAEIKKHRREIMKTETTNTLCPIYGGKMDVKHVSSEAGRRLSEKQ